MEVEAPYYSGDLGRTSPGLLSDTDDITSERPCWAWWCVISQGLRCCEGDEVASWGSALLPPPQSDTSPPSARRRLHRAVPAGAVIYQVV